MINKGLKEGIGYDLLKNDPDFAKYNVFVEDMKITLARLYEPTEGGGVQRLSDTDIARYADMALSYTTQDELAAKISIDALNEVIARRIGAQYTPKYSNKQRIQSGAEIPEELGNLGQTGGPSVATEQPPMGGQGAQGVDLTPYFKEAQERGMIKGGLEK